MSDNAEQQAEQQGQQTERDILFQRLRLMGLNPGGATGTDKLREMLNQAVENGPASVKGEAEQDKEKTVNPLNMDSGVKPEMTLREQIIAEQTKLVRLRITNLDPKKKDLPGEVITVANEYMGTIRKFVPYGEQTDEGFHVPYCIYAFMRDRQFLDLRSRTNKQTKLPDVSQNWVREFALEVLPPLTEEEIKKLAISQQAAGSLGN